MKFIYKAWKNINNINNNNNNNNNNNTEIDLHIFLRVTGRLQAALSLQMPPTVGKSNRS